jgi:hypothetical protein
MGLVQVVQCLPRKCKAMSSNPNTDKMQSHGPQELDLEILAAVWCPECETPAFLCVQRVLLETLKHQNTGLCPNSRS